MILAVHSEMNRRGREESRRESIHHWHVVGTERREEDERMGIHRVYSHEKPNPTTIPGRQRTV